MNEPFLDPDSRTARDASRAEKSVQDAQRSKNDLSVVLGTENGRRFVYNLLGDAGVFRSSFVAGDPYGTTFNEGQRNLGLRLLSAIMTDAPDQYMILLKENTSANA